MGSRICPPVLSLSQTPLMSCPCLELLPQVLCASFGDSAKKVLERLRTGPATWYIDDGQKHWYLSYVNPLRINKKKVNIQFSKKETGCSERKKYEETNRKQVQTCQLIHETRKPCVVLQSCGQTGPVVHWSRPRKSLWAFRVHVAGHALRLKNVHMPRNSTSSSEDSEKACGHGCPS